jgi:sec-independent protein translocase protein TatA
MTPLFGFLGEFSLFHWLIVGGIGILLFGKRLPEVGRSLGKGIREFQKGFKGLEDDLDVNPSAGHQDKPALDTHIRPPQRIQATAPKFESPQEHIQADEPRQRIQAPTPKFDNGPPTSPSGPTA